MREPTARRRRLGVRSVFALVILWEKNFSKKSKKSA
jgi:hypothetical protein